MRREMTCIIIGLFILSTASRVEAQHLWWNTQKLDNATVLYGEITVLATHHGVYYCGANWRPGEPAGGYCGIQDNGPHERRTIFSIWDTSATLHPHVSQADPKTIFNRFGGEGEGAHTHMLWNWKLGETFKFFVHKLPSAVAGATDTRYYIYDRAARRWRHSATITSPNGDPRSAVSVESIGGGGLASFLENFVGQDRAVPKLALYRLWLGRDVDHLTCLTRAKGDGTWGELNDSYFLAEGSHDELQTLFDGLSNRFGAASVATPDQVLEPISNRVLSARLRRDLKTLPVAPGVLDR